MTAPPIPQDPFSPLEEATLRAIAETGIVRTFPKNAVLIHEGDSGDALYIVLQGRVKVYASNAQGREFAIAFHGPGEYVGEMTLDGGVRSASVVTIDPTVCAIVHREQFREFILKNPDFALHLIEKLIMRVRATTEDVKSLALTDVYGRLVRVLLSLAQEREGQVVVAEKLTQQDIAERVGSSRDMISRLMKDLVAGGYLAVEDRTIVILKRPPAAW